MQREWQLYFRVTLSLQLTKIADDNTSFINTPLKKVI